MEGDIDFLRFELTVRPARDGHVVEVRSPAGEISGPLDVRQDEPFLTSLATGRRAPDLATARAVGGRLFEALFSPPVRERYRESLGMVRERDAALDVSLRCDVPALATLPWELLYDTVEDRFLATSRATPFTRYVSLPTRLAPLAVTPPLRLLLIAAAPADLAPLDTAAEVARIELALDDLRASGHIEIRALPHASPQTLREALDWQPHLLHFTGHGVRGELVLEDQYGDALPLSREELAALLQETEVRAAVLMACSTAARRADDVGISGLGPVLVQATVAAVVSMQQELPEQAARAFCAGFYRALAERQTLSHAINAARHEMRVAQPEYADWAVPIMHTRVPHGRFLPPNSERARPVAVQGLEAAVPPLRAAPAVFSNLPAELGPFVGRQAEIAALREQLSRTRLLTICGGAGVGKTRTAVQLARETAPQFKDGVGFVELGSVSDANLVVRAVASVFGVRESGTSLKDSLIFYLQKRTVLLILDNCEHLLDACADFIAALLRRSSDLKVIATTRERLDIDGEVVCGLQMLPLPAAPEAVTVGDMPSYPALELFVAESVNADPTFTVTDQNIVQIAEICKRLDGNALAIKLAAALTPTLSVGEMLERLRERFDVLVQGRRQSVARHKTLKAAMDWSYELLTPEEATLFRRLAVFAGSWTLEAVEHVCADDTIRQSALVTLMNGLVRKSLVLTIPGGTESRFDLLETVREYAGMQLRASGDMERLQLAHAKYFTALARREAGKVWGPEPEVGLARLEQVYDDLLRALEWTRKAEVGKQSGLSLQLAAALGPFWEHRGFLSEGRERLAQALRDKRRPEHDKHRVAALEAAARLVFLQSDYVEAIALYEKSLKLRRAMASKKQDTRLQHGVVGVLNKIGVAAARNGDLVLAEQRLREALELAKKTNHTRGIVGAIDHLAEVAWRQGDFDTALERYRECRTYARQQRGKYRALSTLDSLIGQGKVLMLQERYDAAAEAFSECLDVLGEHGTKTDRAYAHSDLSEVAFRKGEYETARRHAEESLRLRLEARNDWGIATAQQQLAQVEHKLGLHADALRHAKESLAIFERLQAQKGLADCLLLVAAIAHDNGDRGVAANLCGAAEMLLDSRGAQLSPPQRAYYERAHLAPARDCLDPQAWTAGRDLSLAKAVLLAAGYAPDEHEPCRAGVSVPTPGR